MQELLSVPLEAHLVAFLLGTPRLLVFMMVAPFMGSSVVTGTAKMVLLFSLYAVMHPVMLEQLPQIFPLSLPGMAMVAALILKEVFVGLMLGWLAGLLFWTIESAGFFIDNQRGAGQATETDPLSGNQSSPTGSFLFQSMAYVFFASGAFLAMLATLYGTFEIWPPARLLPHGFFSLPSALFFGKLLARLMLDLVLLSAPVVLACLFTDMSLGIINRFASQLNVYVLAMPIKSAISSFLLILYFGIIIKSSPERFSIFNADLAALRAFLP